MSYTIATSIKIDPLGKITGRGGCNNVRPFYSSDFEYEDKERFMHDILSGGLDIDGVRSKIAEKARNARQTVRGLHKARYGKDQDAYMYGTKSINPFSLYMIANVYFSDKQGQKDEFLTNTADLTHVGKQYQTERLVEHAIFKTKWDEYVEFYKFLLIVFFKEINN